MDEYEKKLWQAVKFCLKVVVGIFIFLLAMLFMYSLNSCTTKKHIVKDVVTTSYDSSSISHKQSSELNMYVDSQKIAETEEEYMLVKFGQDGCIELAADGTQKLKGVQGIKMASKRQHNEEKATKEVYKKDSVYKNNTITSNHTKVQHIDKQVSAPLFKHYIYYIFGIIITVIIIIGWKTKFPHI